MIFNTSFSNVTVLKISVAIPVKTGGTLTYNGNVQSPTWDYDETIIQLVSGGSGTDAGIYNAVFQLNEPDKYMWEDKGSSNKTIQWEIDRATISNVPSQSGTLTYTGNVQSPTWNNYDSTKMTVSGDTSAVDAGTYTIEFIPTSNYKWSNGSYSAITISWSIGKKTISAIPYQSGNLIYNGNELSPDWGNYNPLELDISGDTTAVNAGEYTATFTPNSNCKWASNDAELVQLPDGYTQISYIENPTFKNEQNLNSGYIPNIIDTLEGKLTELCITLPNDLSSIDNSKIYDILGYYRLSTAYHQVAYEKIYFSNNSICFTSYNDGTRNPIVSIDIGNSRNLIIKLYDNSTAYVNQNYVSYLEVNGVQKTGIDWPFVGSAHWYGESLFRITDHTRNSSGNTITYGNTSASFKFKYLKQYDFSNNLERYCVPCYNSNGLIGVYDIVQGKFIACENSSTLLSGPDATNDISDNIDPVDVTWTIDKATVSSIPVQSGTLTYTGSILTPTWDNYDSNALTISGNTDGTNAGNYTVEFTPTSNYKWWDDTTTEKSATWSISKADVNIAVNPTSLSLDEENTSGNITVTRNSTGAITATSSNTALATVNTSSNIVNVTGIKSGDVSITISVDSDDNYNSGSIQVPVILTLPQMYSVTANIDPSGSGTVSGTGNYAGNSEVTLIANPDDDYEFAGWQVKTIKSRLPNGYTELEYLTTNVGTTFTTSIPVTTTTTRVVCDIEPIEKVTAYNALIFSGIQAAIGGAFLSLDSKSSTITYKTGPVVDSGDSSNKGTFSYDLKANTRITIDMDTVSKKIKIGSSTYSITTVASSGTQAFLRFGYNGILSPNTYAGLKMKIYSAQVYIGDELKGDFAPCIDNNNGNIGLYDLVNSEFIPNYSVASPSSPTAGPEIEAEEVIEIVSTEPTYTFTVTNDVELTAVFKVILPEYTITATVNPDGSGTVTGTGVYEENTLVSLEATANDGYEFSNWTENTIEEPLSTENPYVFDAVRDIDLVANFEETPQSSVFGVMWNYENSSTALTRLTPSNDPHHYVTKSPSSSPVSAVGTGSGSSPFDDYMPWAGMEEYNINGTTIGAKQGESGFSRTAYDTMVYIPEFWYNCIDDATNKKRYWYVSDTELEGFEKHPGSGKYVSRYTANSSYKSVSGNQSVVNITMATGRTKAKAKGTGWQLFDYASLCAVQLLYLVEYADWNSQAKIGRGYVDGNTKQINTGATDSMTYHTGRASGTDGKTAIQYRHIENLWGNLYQWIDGINFYDRKAYVSTNPSNYAENTSTGYTDTGITLPTTSSYITGIGYSTNSKWTLIPNAASGGSDSTYVTDSVYSSTGWKTFGINGLWSTGSATGAFYFRASNDSSSTSNYWSVRFLYNP